MNINDGKDLRPSPKTHPINTNTTPRQLSPFNDQLADFREPPRPLSGRNSLTDHKKKLMTFPKLLKMKCGSDESLPCAKLRRLDEGTLYKLKVKWHISNKHGLFP